MCKKYLASLIKRKTNIYFRLSLTAFLASFMMLIVSSILLISQYNQINADFINNANTHIIEITSYGTKDDGYLSNFLSLDDISKVNYIIKSNDNFSARVFSEYSINFGINANDDFVFLRSCDDVKLPEITELKYNEAYCNIDIDNKALNLSVPQISISDGGYTSKEYTNRQINLVKTDTNTIPLSVVNTNDNILFVNMNTFQDLIADIYSISWDDFILRYSEGEDFGINLLSKIYVYYDDLTDAKPLANALEMAGYDITYAMGAFENMAESINTSLWMFFALVIIIMLVTSGNVIISFRNYFLTSKKDMGILKFYGYSADLIRKIYSSIINNIFIIILVLGFICTLVLSVVVINRNNLETFIIIMTGETFLLLFIKSVVNRMLNKLCRSGILDLLKNDKQTE